MKNKDQLLGPSAPWYDDDEEIEYVRDDLALESLIEHASIMLVESLQTRIRALKTGDLEKVQHEIRQQIAYAARHNRLGEVRVLHDLSLELYMAQDKAERSV